MAKKNGVTRAIEAAGGVANMCADLGVTHQSIYLWKRQGFVPPLRAVEIESLYGISRLDLFNPRLLHLVDLSDGGE